MSNYGQPPQAPWSGAEQSTPDSTTNQYGQNLAAFNTAQEKAGSLAGLTSGNSPYPNQPFANEIDSTTGSAYGPQGPPLNTGANPFGPQDSAYQYGGYSAGAQQYSSYYGALAAQANAQAQAGVAPVNYGQYGVGQDQGEAQQNLGAEGSVAGQQLALAGQQQGLASMLQAQAMGQGPNPAAAQYQQAIDKGMQQQQAIASSARGGAMGLESAQRNAAGNATQLALQGSQQLGVQEANQQLGAEQALGAQQSSIGNTYGQANSTFGQMGSQEQGLAAQGIQAGQFGTSANLQNQGQQLGYSAGMSQAQQNVNAEQLQSGQNARNAQQAAAQNKSATNMQIGGAAISAGGNALAAVASDVQNKTDIQGGGSFGGNGYGGPGPGNGGGSFGPNASGSLSSSPPPGPWGSQGQGGYSNGLYSGQVAAPSTGGYGTGQQGSFGGPPGGGGGYPTSGAQAQQNGGYGGYGQPPQSPWGQGGQGGSSGGGQGPYAGIPGAGQSTPASGWGGQQTLGQSVGGLFGGQQPSGGGWLNPIPPTPQSGFGLVAQEGLTPLAAQLAPAAPIQAQFAPSAQIAPAPGPIQAQFSSGMAPAPRMAPAPLPQSAMHPTITSDEAQKDFSALGNWGDTTADNISNDPAGSAMTMGGTAAGILISDKRAKEEATTAGFRAGVETAQQASSPSRTWAPPRAEYMRTSGSPGLLSASPGAPPPTPLVASLPRPMITGGRQELQTSQYAAPSPPETPAAPLAQATGAISSDEDGKDPKQRVADNLIDGFLDRAAESRAAYRYKSPELEPTDHPTGGMYLGAMAQSIEKAPAVGRQIVKDGPRGKYLEGGALSSALLAGAGRLTQRVRALEQRGR